MITRYNTNRDATRQVISASIFMVLILAIAPTALVLTAPESPTSTAVLVTYGFFWGCGLLLLVFCVYRYFHWGEDDDAYLLSSKTLAVVSPGKPALFVKPCDIVALKPSGMKLLREDGAPLRLPRQFPGPGEMPLPVAIVATWHGEDRVEKAKRASQNAIRPSTGAIAVFMLLVGAALLVALGLALAGMWRVFAGFMYPAFIAGMGIATLYQLVRAYKADKLVVSLVRNPANDREGSFPDQTTRSRSPRPPVEIKRLPEERPRIWRVTGGTLLVLLGLAIFIPFCKMILSYDTLEQNMRHLVYLIGFDLGLVAIYCVWRLYQGVVRGDIFVTVLLSPRTLAIVRPHAPFTTVKPEHIAALVCGRNELVLKNGELHSLTKDADEDGEWTVCKTICQQWWPEACGELESGFSQISKPCKRQMAIGGAIAAIGVVLLIASSGSDPGPWGTAIAFHFMLPGATYAVYGFWRGLRGHGRVIELAPLNPEDLPDD